MLKLSLQSKYEPLLLVWQDIYICICFQSFSLFLFLLLDFDSGLAEWNVVGWIEFRLSVWSEYWSSIRRSRDGDILRLYSSILHVSLYLFMTYISSSASFFLSSSFFLFLFLFLAFSLPHTHTHTLTLDIGNSHPLQLSLSSSLPPPNHFCWDISLLFFSLSAYFFTRWSWIGPWYSFVPPSSSPTHHSSPSSSPPPQHAHFHSLPPTLHNHLSLCAKVAQSYSRI